MCMTLSIMLSISAPEDQKVMVVLIPCACRATCFNLNPSKALTLCILRHWCSLVCLCSCGSGPLLSHSTRSSWGAQSLSFSLFAYWVIAFSLSMVIFICMSTPMKHSRSTTNHFFPFPFFEVACALCLVFKSLFSSTLLLKFGVAAVGFVWSTRASVVFMSQVISPERKVLAVYPVFFFYTFITWMVIIS